MVLKNFREGFAVNISRRIDERIWHYVLNYEMEVGMKGSEYSIPHVLTTNMIFDLSNNNLIGEILEGIESLVFLILLNLSWNQLEGKIPVSLRTISTLEQLDLTKNNLSREIPPKLSELQWLGSVNFSFNNLCGSIPKGQFPRFNATSFQRNKCLCGFPLPECKKNASKKNNTRSIGGWFHYMDKKISLIALGIGVVIRFGGVVMVFISWKKARDWVVPPNRTKLFYGEYRLPT